MPPALHARADWNTCAQSAVVDTLLALRVLPPAAPDKSSEAGWRQTLLARVLERFPPDAPLGMGTSAFRLRAALRAYGVGARLVHAGLFARHRNQALDEVLAHVATGLPALVCLDDGLLGGTAWAAHWTRLESLDGSRARLADGARVREVPRARFLAAWRCRQLPWPHTCCAILAGPRE